MIDKDKYMKLAEGVARTANERSLWYGLVGEVSNLFERVKVLEKNQVGTGPATVTKPPTKKKTTKKKVGE